MNQFAPDRRYISNEGLEFIRRLINSALAIGHVRSWVHSRAMGNDDKPNGCVFVYWTIDSELGDRARKALEEAGCLCEDPLDAEVFGDQNTINFIQDPAEGPHPEQQLEDESNPWCQIALYLADCHAATASYEGMMSRTSRSSRERLANICEKTADLLQHPRRTHVLHPSTLSAVQRCQQAARDLRAKVEEIAIKKRKHAAR